ncbi:MAG: hypothetical protein HY784_12450 [Chloroflexi bacterium]|nr:hypothetical protein [Chloroflexota bacterium]
MMTGTKELTSRHTTMGDAAVDGLWGGAQAGALMVVVLLAAGVLGGDGPAAVLARFDPSEPGSPVVGILLHLAASGVYGVLFGIGWQALGARWRGRPLVTLAAGIAFGLASLAVAEWIILPGTESALGQFPFAAFALGHLVYGAGLGWLVGRAGTRAH